MESVANFAQGSRSSHEIRATAVSVGKCAQIAVQQSVVAMCQGSVRKCKNDTSSGSEPFDHLRESRYIHGKIRGVSQRVLRNHDVILR